MFQSQLDFWILPQAEACEKELQILQKDYERKEKEWQEKLQEAKDNFYRTQMITDRQGSYKTHGYDLGM